MFKVSIQPQWTLAEHENGKLLQKKNTFTDFIDVTEFLLREKFAHPQRVYAEGGSKVVWVDFQAQRSKPLPDWLRALVEPDVSKL